MTRWQPTPFVRLCMAMHGVVVLPIWSFDLWPWAIGTVFLSHMAMLAAGLWPRSTVLGQNMVRLPEAAAHRGEVAITIDDGPEPLVTPQVLEILAAHGARASFFCTGVQAAAHPELCRAIAAAGHAVENHGQTHRKRCAVLGPRGWLAEVGDAQATLQAITGQRPRFFRSMAGLRNVFLAPVLHRLDVRLVAWTTRGFDTHTADADVVLARLTRKLAAGDILLLHDGHAARNALGRPVILDVLPRLLAEIAARNLKPVTLAAGCNLP
jgi:peptidoglycan/xylan/chitin deacetylase (PgdA/CDA1 family)